MVLLLPPLRPAPSELVLEGSLIPSRFAPFRFVGFVMFPLLSVAAPAQLVGFCFCAAAEKAGTLTKL